MTSCMGKRDGEKVVTATSSARGAKGRRLVDETDRDLFGRILGLSVPMLARLRLRRRRRERERAES